MRTKWRPASWRATTVIRLPPPVWLVALYLDPLYCTLHSVYLVLTKQLVVRERIIVRKHTVYEEHVVPADLRQLEVDTDGDVAVVAGESPGAE